MNKNTFKVIAILAFGIFYLSLLPSCGVKAGGVVIGSSPPPSPAPKSGPPPWAPAHGHRAKHRYRYYPHHYVYFDLGRGVYFYLEGDGWRVSAQLPSRIHLAYASYVTLEMETDRPYQNFSEHKKKYPPGQVKKNKKQKKK